VAEKKKELLARKAKEAGEIANKAGEGVANVWKDLNGKAKDGIQRAYLAKRPLAVAKVKALREDNPKITPGQAQEILDAELNGVEAAKGPLSVRYTSAAALYVMSSMELRQLDPKNKETAKVLFNLLLILDARAVKGLRYLLNAALWLVPQLKAAKGAKAGAAVAKSAQVAAKATKAKKVIKAAKAVAVPAAKGGLKKLINSGKASSYIIEQTARTLGPTPASWKAQGTKPSKSKAAPKNVKEVILKAELRP
jgi:hypothetical protein